MEITTIAFQGALAILCALVAAVGVSHLTTAVRTGSNVFLQLLLAVLVVVQLFYLYQASRHQLSQS
ncbi:hypothetical protein PC116_g1754 [Phytophthora cactorum]|nr:hypothetical protein PC128_g938 [Phytophthora cactorum]KAG4250563.1 hypothetical protein PC116_g1754 [Phytophthora cactorum]